MRPASLRNSARTYEVHGTLMHYHTMKGSKLQGRKGELSRVEFLGEMGGFLHSRALLPLIPPTPFSHKGRRGSLGVLMHETGDGTRGLAKTSTPVRFPQPPFSHKGRRGRLGVLMAETGDGTQGLAKTSTPVRFPQPPFSHKGRRGRLGVLMPKTSEGAQGPPKQPAPHRSRFDIRASARHRQRRQLSPE
jgi:hypothetical protein